MTGAPYLLKSVYLRILSWRSPLRFRDKRSVYIRPRYFYLIFRSVNINIMNRVILHSVRPSFWKKLRFSHAPRCGSTESGCEISVPWWWILADLGKMTSVWSRERDTGDTSEPFLNNWEQFSQRQKWGAELIRDVKRWRHAWLVIIHVHVAEDVLHDFNCKTDQS